MKKSLLKTQVLIIGGGITGTGIARDLSLRGISCVLAEKKDLNAGASGGNHGLLHSGARYVASDPEAAKECAKESELLKQLAPHCIEDTGGLYVAVKGDDESYIADFPAMCARCGIDAKPIDLADARDMEPLLSRHIIAAYSVKDGSVDPFKLSLENISDARQRGAVWLPYTAVTSLITKHGRIQKAILKNMKSQKETIVETEQVVNASGAWANEIASLAGIKINMVFSKGSLIVTQNRITDRVINRLRKPANGDILVPGGTVSILGTTSIRTESPDRIHPGIQEVDTIIREGAAMIPALDSIRYIRAYCGVRPLVSSRKEKDDRNVTRGFALLDHSGEGLENFITITGGKLTTYRLMAEKTADLVCKQLGKNIPCTTRTTPLPETMDARWTEPGSAPKMWIGNKNPEDLLICECEMVPKSTVEAILSSMHTCPGSNSLTAIGLRSRIGKGQCQGTFCSLRLTSFLYDREQFTDNSGLSEIKAFLRERWRGQRPLLWGTALVQSELQEALHCGLLGLELDA